MLGLYAVKSVSFIFPIAILQLAVGHLFSTGTALLVNFLGRAVTLALPYWMGRFPLCHGGKSYFQISEAENSGELPERKSSVYFLFYENTEFLPRDAVSLFLGALKIPFGVYMLGGMLGTLQELSLPRYLEQISKIQDHRHSGFPQCFL